MYNSIPGRYVNRIGYGKYDIDGKEYLTEQNDGNNTLHSGTNNWSYRFWEATKATANSITFSILDKSNSSQNMLGDVSATVTYTVKDSALHIKMGAASPQQKTRRFPRGRGWELRVLVLTSTARAQRSC